MMTVRKAGRQQPRKKVLASRRNVYFPSDIISWIDSDNIRDHVCINGADANGLSPYVVDLIRRDRARKLTA